MNNGSGITVTKLEIECQLPANSVNASGVAARLTKIARTKLSDVLADCLQPLEISGEEIVLIKSLQLDMDIDLLLSEQQIASLWATKIQKSLLRAISTKNSSSMAVFASPASYLAAALLDMVRGRAQQLWYYRQFNGLWSLPLSAALRTALLEEPARGLAALAQMPQPELAELCAVLSDDDARRVLDGLFARTMQADIAAIDAQIFVNAINDCYSMAQSVNGKKTQQIMLLASLALAKQPALQPPKLYRLAELFSVFMRLRYGYMEHFPQLIQALLQQQTSQLPQWLPATQIAELLPLSQLSDKVLSCLAQPMLASMSDQQTNIAGAALQNGFSWFGNALLLLPQITSLPLQAVSVWPALNRQLAVNLLHWLVLCVCQGTDKFSAAVRDPLLRDLCGVGPNVTLSDVVEWLNQQFTQQQATQLFAQLKQQVLGDRHGEESLLQSVQWQQDGNRIVVQEDIQKGRWMHLQMEISPANSAAVTAVDNNELQTRAQADFASLWPDPRFKLNETTSACLVVLAQFTLKSFAYRLPGFARCSARYLLQNFLCMSVTLVAEKDYINAWLSRVPMSVLLNMTGINRGVIQLPDYDARMIRLQESG